MKNKHKVDKKVWSSWSDQAKNAFNYCYEWFLGNQSKMAHPKAEAIKKEHWETIAWNAAWIAANDAVDNCKTTIVGS